MGSTDLIKAIAILKSEDNVFEDWSVDPVFEDRGKLKNHKP